MPLCGLVWKVCDFRRLWVERGFVGWWNIWCWFLYVGEVAVSHLDASSSISPWQVFDYRGLAVVGGILATDFAACELDVSFIKREKRRLQAA